MSNDIYNVSGAPAQRSSLSSQAIRNEFSLIAQGLDKFPAFTGNAGRLLKLNAGATAFEFDTATYLTTAAAAATYLTQASAAATYKTIAAADAADALRLLKSGDTMTGALLGALGAAGTPGFAFAGDANNGWWSPGAGVQAWSTAGAERMRLDASGYFLLGATASTGAGVRRAQLGSAADATAGLLVSSTSAAVSLYAGSLGDAYIPFRTGATLDIGHAPDNLSSFTSRLKIDASGNVGIGVAPADRLNLGGTNNVYARWQSVAVGGAGLVVGVAADVQAEIAVATAHPLAFYIAGVEHMRLGVNGNLGLGQASPVADIRLNVLGYGSGTTAGSNAAALRLASTSASRDVNIAFTDGTAWNTIIGATGAGDLYFSVSGTPDFAERARISAAGVFTYGGIEVGYRGLPRVTSVGLALRGKCAAMSASPTLAGSDGWLAGDCIAIYNDSAAAITIVQGAGMTLRLAGTTTTGSRTLAARGMCTIWFNSGSEGICSGSGLS